MNFLHNLFGPPNIGKLKEKGDIQGLIKALANSEACNESMDALSQIGKPAVNSLVLALRDENKIVSQSAAHVLEKIGGPAVLELVNGLTSGNQTADDLAANVLKKLGNIAVDQLISGLNDKDSGVRQKSAFGLEKLQSKRAVAPLIAKLQGLDSDAGEHFFAARALGSLGDVEAVNQLIVALKDPKMPVRQIAAEALGKIKDIRAVEPLIDTFMNIENPNKVRMSAGIALGELQDARAVEPLVSWLTSPNIDSGDRMFIIVALGKINDVRAIKPIREVLNNDTNPFVKTAAESALKKLSLQQNQTLGDDAHKSYSGYTKAVIYCKADFNVSSIRLPGFTGNAEVIRAGNAVEQAEIVATMLLSGCDKDCILLSVPDYGVGFIK